MTTRVKLKVWDHSRERIEDINLEVGKELFLTIGNIKIFSVKIEGIEITPDKNEIVAG
jgi:hypothetical protein